MLNKILWIVSIIIGIAELIVLFPYFFPNKGDFNETFDKSSPDDNRFQSGEETFDTMMAKFKLIIYFGSAIILVLAVRHVLGKYFGAPFSIGGG